MGQVLLHRRVFSRKGRMKHNWDDDAWDKGYSDKTQEEQLSLSRAWMEISKMKSVGDENEVLKVGEPTMLVVKMTLPGV